jgi:hypothetical protein
MMTVRSSGNVRSLNMYRYIFSAYSCRSEVALSEGDSALVALDDGIPSRNWVRPVV